MHYVAHLPYYAEILAFLTFRHFFVFWIVRKDVNAIFISLEAFYESCSPVVYGVDSVRTVIAEIVIKDDIIVKKSWLHGVSTDIGCTHVFAIFFQLGWKCNVINYISRIRKLLASSRRKSLLAKLFLIFKLYK